MARVYFKAIDSYTKTKEISAAGRELLKRLVEKEKVKLSRKIPLKVHFGEKGNITYISADNYDGIIDYLEEQTITTFYTDTNVLYAGERMTRDKHRKLAKDHGFTRVPVEIADGDHGNDFKEVFIDKKHFKSCKVGKLVGEYDQLLIIAHFKGHMLSGFGGAVKQLGMGCAARGGKLTMHHSSKPKIIRRKCNNCGSCAENCPADAIYVKGKAHKIDLDKCVGCASCIAVCRYKAAKVRWTSINLFKAFGEKLAEYAFAAQKDKSNIYMTFAFNITRGCDCMGKKMKVIMPDLGMLASTDPVAIDKACLDLIDERARKKKFEGRHMLEYAEGIGLGSRKYELVKL
ncbi:MAG: DUF362 domain-containing protein [Candidatus Thermoplasmatota archaeon]|jgi:hypothetical protein|nr:DUF362 domain-containing protein [Candidatus Thermoplasmatota archaeon]MDP7266036.1 DUF362 domain-containing protein [Candidatus Thermoplasmatota archaeon]